MVVIIESQAGSSHGAVLPPLTKASLGVAPARKIHGGVTTTEKLLRAVDPELVVEQTMKVSRVGVRNQRHRAAFGDEETNALSRADVFCYLPL